MLRSKKYDYEALYETYVNEMFSYGLALGVERHTLHDIVHDVFLHLFEHQNEIGEGDHQKYYLFRCMKNRMVSLKRQEVCTDDINEFDSYEFSIKITGLELIEEEEERKELAERIEKMMQVLTCRQREAIYLRFMQELEYDEVAELLGLTTKGARKLIYRSIDRIRELYGPTFLYFFLSGNFS